MITLVGNQLRIENAHFRRTWRITGKGQLLAESFQDRRSGQEWLTPPATLPDDAIAATLAPCPPPSVIEAESQAAELGIAGQAYTLQIFPDVAGVRVTCSAISRSYPSLPSPHLSRERWGEGRRLSGGERSTGIETDPVPTASTPRAAGESLTLGPTDHHNGLIFLKEAPLPTARPLPSAWDLRVQPAERRFTLGTDAYASVTLAYTGGKRGRIAALQHYQRCLRPYVPGRDGLLVSNTWGDRNRDARVTAEFMAQEIEAGARLGIDVIQIDDGWEVGTTSNSVRAKEQGGGVWEGFYAATDHFWAVHPERFPQGLEPLVQAAKDHNLRFGLWFGPDSAKVTKPGTYTVRAVVSGLGGGKLKQTLTPERLGRQAFRLHQLEIQP